MNTKEFEEIKSEDLYEVTGGNDKNNASLVEIVNIFYSKIKEIFN